MNVLHQQMYALPRKFDFCLMDVIYEEVQNVYHVHIFNHMRIALKLHSASDIITLGSGTQILQSILDGKNYRQSTLGWPNSEPIPTQWLKVWKSLLRNLLFNLS